MPQSASELSDLITVALAAALKGLPPELAVRAIVVSDGVVRLELAAMVLPVQRLVLTPSEQKIVDAIGEKTDLTSEEIALIIGRSPESNIRKELSGMRIRGILTGEKGSPGYGVYPLYRVVCISE